MGMMGSNNNNSASSKFAQGTLSEINVTPFVDVMLVLLIIFMVSAPLMQQGVQVDLPKTKSTALDEQTEQIVLVIKKGGRLEINDNRVRHKHLRKKLAAIYENKSKREIFIQADRRVNYGIVAKIMSEVKLAGITKVGLVTEAPKK